MLLVVMQIWYFFNQNNTFGNLENTATEQQKSLSIFISFVQ